MDPNACLATILRLWSECRTHHEVNTSDELLEACENLADWLRSGGFAPSATKDMLSSKGEWYELGPRFCLMTCHPGDRGSWMLVEWNDRGDKIASWNLKGADQ